MRLIDAEALIDAIECGKRVDMPTRELEAVLNDVKATPSIDIVRCVECRYKGMEICAMYKLTKAGVLKPYDFCSYGSRSEKPNNLSEIPTGSERSSE